MRTIETAKIARLSFASMMTIAILTLMFNLIAIQGASAEEVLVTAPIKQVVNAVDKNGNPYTRLTIEEPKSLNGVKYNMPVTVMIFASSGVDGSSLKEGDTFKAICSKSEYRGRMNYQAIALIE
jgi:hypothetical protein